MVKVKTIGDTNVLDLDSKFCGLKIIYGTKVVTTLGGGNSMALFNRDELAKLFDVEASKIVLGKIVAFCTNGDAAGFGGHLDGTSWLNNTLYAVFGVSTTNPARVNYFIMLLP